MKTLKQTLKDTKNEFEQLATPEIRSLVGTLFEALEIEDEPADTFPEIYKQLEDLTKIVEYHSFMGKPVRSTDGTDLTQEAADALLVHLFGILELR